MQAISDHVVKTWNNIKGGLVNHSQGGMVKALIGDATIPASVVGMVDEVSSIRKAYCKETSAIKQMGTKERLSDEVLNPLYKEVYDKYTEMCTKFLDRKAFALAAVHESENTTDNFALICAFDGIVELLAEQASTVVRHIKVDVPRGVTAITVTDGVATYETVENTVVSSHNVTLPISFEDGVYGVTDTMNARYMHFEHALTKEDKDSIVKHAYSRQSGNTKAVSVNLIKNVNYDMVISGFVYKRNSKTGKPHNAETVLEAITNANYKAMVVEESITLKNGATNKVASLKVGGEIIATIKATDRLKIKDGGAVDFSGMYGRVLTLDISKAQPYITRKGDNKPTYAGSLQVSCMVDNIVPINIEMGPEYAACDFSKPYFNIGVIESERRYKVFSDWGYTHTIALADKAIAGQKIAQVTLAKDDEIIFIDVNYGGKAVGLVIDRITKDEIVIDHTQKKYGQLVACIYRTVSLEWAKAHFKAPVVDTTEAEKFQQERKDYFRKIRNNEQMLNAIARYEENLIRQKAREERRARLQDAEKIRQRERVDYLAFWNNLVVETKKKGFYTTLTSIVDGKVVEVKEPDVWAYYNTL
jgi:hypothetical protein